MPERKSAAPRVNDFTLKFANVNGSGSASANSLVMKAIFRMGVPVVGKNFFPSNIQGLPTWYEIRVTREGWRARSGRIDLMVAMNAETYARDLREVSAGGYLVYDSTWPRPNLHAREDVHTFGVPFAAAVHRQLRGRARAHADEEHHVRRHGRGADRHRPRGDPRPARGDLRQEAEAGRLEHEGDRDRLPVREGALRVPAADPRRAHGRDGGPRDDRRQHRRGARLPLRGRDRRRLVPDHAVDFADGRVPLVLRAPPHRPRRPAGATT